jgi:hypothetical protein
MALFLWPDEVQTGFSAGLGENLGCGTLGGRTGHFMRCQGSFGRFCASGSGSLSSLDTLIEYSIAWIVLWFMVALLVKIIWQSPVLPLYR